MLINIKFAFTVFEMFPFESKSVLWPAQQIILPKRVKFSVKHQKKFFFVEITGGMIVVQS